MSDNKQSFEQWLDGQSGDNNNPADWAADPTLADRYDTSLWLRQQADCFEEEDVPEWDRGATFVQSHTHTPWWQWQGWPIASMATAFSAILLVLFQVQLRVDDQGLVINFGDNQERQYQQQMQDQLDLRMQEYAVSQQLILTNYLEDHRQQQQQNTLEMVSYLVKSGREERKQELSELVTFFNDQRTDDNQFYMSQINQIQYEFDNK